MSDETFPASPVYGALVYNTNIKLFGVDDTLTPPRPGWLLSGQLGGGGGTTALVFVFIGAPAAGGTISLPMPFAVTIPANLAGTLTFSTPPAAAAAFTLQATVSKAVIDLGTITVEPGSATNFVLSTQDAATIPAGAVVRMIAPATADATLADCSFTVLAARA